MGKTTRAGGGTVNGAGQTQPAETLLRGARTVIRDGAIEFAATDGGVPDTVITRASGGGLSTPGAQTVGGNLTVSGNETVAGTLDVTGTLTAFGYLGVGGNSGVTGSVDVAGNLAGDWHPRDAGLIAWSIDPALASGTLQVTNGTIYLTKLPIPRSVTPTKLYWYVTTGATTPTASQCWVAVLDSTGAVLGSAVDVATTSGSSGLKTTTVAPGALSVGFVWGAIVLNAGTPGTLAMAPATALSTLTNVGLTAATLRHATNGTSQTTITARTPASNSAGPAVWMGLGT